MRGLVTLLAPAVAAACAELPLPPQVESAGEPGAPIYVASGAFTPMGYSATGRATYLLDEAGMAALTLSADFTVPDVPRVSIFLSNSPDLELAVKVGELQTRTGAQRWTFRVPRGAVWSWTVLWSEELWVGVARARLQPEG